MSGAEILGIIVAYQVALIAIGLWARRRTRDHTDYFIGGRNLGGLVASLSYAAGSSSAWSILGVSGIAYVQGLSAVWLLPGTLTGHVIAWFLLARRLREASRTNGWVTLTDVVCRDLAGGARRFATDVSRALRWWSRSFSTWRRSSRGQATRSPRRSGCRCRRASPLALR